jgi:DNA recombination protein RmuC
MSLEFLALIVVLITCGVGFAYVWKLLEQKNSIIIELEKANEKLIYKNELDLQRLHEQKNELKSQINEMTQNLLDAKIKSFDESSIKSLENLLKPFKENIEQFKTKVEESQKQSGERLAALSKEIELVTKAGLSMTQEAQNLTKALKGEKQAQGRWGEMILESVLEHSGLVKDKHYLIQESYKDDDGNIKRPDVVVKLPEDKSLIIDSKVSLVDYDAYIKAPSEEQRVLEAKKIAKAFRAHIDTLSSKTYSSYDNKTLQYVFMFVPIESAYAIATHADDQLYEYALKKHIVIVYPSTLIVTLKTIYIYWQKEQSDIAVEKIFAEAGKLYDKVEGFIKTFDRVGTQLETLNKSYEMAQKQLYSGTGNILKRTEDLKILGAKTTKTIAKEKAKLLEFDEDG